MALPRAEGCIDRFVGLVLGHVGREYPSKLDHVINDAGDLRGPRELHPVFFGSFDWHSCVHGYWLLVRALRCFPGVARAAEVRALLDERLTGANVAAEVAYLNLPRRGTFERPYGWAWLLKLAAELKAGAAGTEGMARWDMVLGPLTAAFVERFKGYLPKATYPVRVGTHQNTAFALALTMDYAREAGDAALAGMIRDKAREWYLKDAGYQAWEPGGTDFLSPGLVEAECMRRVLGEGEFLEWLGRFLPRLGEREPAALFEPAVVSDRTDGQIAHLDGLNLSRAWCWRAMGLALPAGDPRRALAEEAYRVHLEAALPHVAGDYMGEHWLATFALLAMTE